MKWCLFPKLLTYNCFVVQSIIALVASSLFDYIDVAMLLFGVLDSFFLIKNVILTVLQYQKPL